MVELTTKAVIDAPNQDDAALTTDIAAAVGDAAEQALDAQGAAGRRWRKRRKRPGHWLCDLLEEAVIALRDLTLTALTTRVVNAACRRAGLGRVGSAVLTAVAGKAMQAATTSVHFPDPAAHLLFLLRVAALAVCPDPDSHPSLETNCANPLAGEVTADGFEIWLHSKHDKGGQTPPP